MAIQKKVLEKLAAMAQQAQISATGNTAEQAYQVFGLYDYWPDIPNGIKLDDGKIVSYSDGNLYRVREGQGHPKNPTWEPDTAVAVFEPIPKPNETGTLDNPISWVSGMVSEQGIYYVDDGIKYLCIEDSNVGLYGQPKDLARYFQKVS